MQLLIQHIEALVFCTQEPIKIADLQRCLSELFNAQVPEEHIKEALQDIEQKYLADDFVFGLEQIAGGYQFLTKPAFQASIQLLLKQKSKKKLSTAAMETLSIIAYKQPITKAGIEAIRGVNSDYALQRLLERELVEIRGKADTLGKPVLYGTTAKLLEHFGINSLTELPTPKDLPNTELEADNPSVSITE